MAWMPARQRNAEAALGESQRTLATLLSNLPGMAYRCLDDEHWTMLFVSEGARRLTGYGRTTSPATPVLPTQS